MSILSTTWGPLSPDQGVAEEIHEHHPTMGNVIIDGNGLHNGGDKAAKKLVKDFIPC